VVAGQTNVQSLVHAQTPTRFEAVERVVPVACTTLYSTLYRL
jgi:hypothetical protein